MQNLQFYISQTKQIHQLFEAVVDVQSLEAQITRAISSAPNEILKKYLEKLLDEIYKNSTPVDEINKIFGVYTDLISNVSADKINDFCNAVSRATSVEIKDVLSTIKPEQITSQYRPDPDISQNMRNIQDIINASWETQDSKQRQIKNRYNRLVTHYSAILKGPDSDRYQNAFKKLLQYGVDKQNLDAAWANTFMKNVDSWTPLT